MDRGSEETSRRIGSCAVSRRGLDIKRPRTSNANKRVGAKYLFSDSSLTRTPDISRADSCTRLRRTSTLTSSAARRIPQKVEPRNWNGAPGVKASSVPPMPCIGWARNPEQGSARRISRLDARLTACVAVTYNRLRSDGSERAPPGPIPGIHLPKWAQGGPPVPLPLTSESEEDQTPESRAHSPTESA